MGASHNQGDLEVTDRDTTPLYPGQDQSVGPAGAIPAGPKLNPGRLWAGGVMTSVVVALMMIVGVSVARGIFAVPVPVPSSADSLSGFAYVALGVLAALVATALAHLLIMATPRPLMFFAWIVFLCTVIAVLAPFQNSVFGSFSHIAMLNAKVATAVINACAGIAVGSLITGAARGSVSFGGGGQGQR